MPKCWSDRAIMFSVIALVAWAIIGLPLLNSLTRSSYEPTGQQAAQPTANSPKSEDRWLTKDAAGFFTFLLVIVGGAQLALFLWQLWLIRESLDDAKLAAEAAKESADATKQQVAETRRIGEAQVRAYVDITQVRLILLMPQVVGAGETTVIRIVAKNTGQSPVRNFLWHPTIQFVATARPGIAAEQKLGANWREMSGIGIAVGQEHGDGATLGWVPLRDEQPAILVFIRVRIDFEFDDVFGEHQIGEAYFAGAFQRKITGFDQTDLGPTRWEGTLRRTNTLPDWDSVAKVDRA